MAEGTSGGGGSHKRAVPAGSARSLSDGMGTVGTGEAAEAGVVKTARSGRSRGTCGGVLARRTDGRRTPPGPKPYPTTGGGVVAAAVLRRVRMEMRPEGRKAVGCAWSPVDEGADEAASVFAVESAPYEVIVGKGACWATAVAAAGASAEPVPPSGGTAKTEAKAMPAAGKIAPRPRRR